MTGPATAATYDCVVTHVRQQPVHNRFRYRTRAWLVDLASPPLLPRGLRWLASFDARDHMGDPARPIRENVAAFLREHGIDIGDGQILMLANARAFGHVFNPISLHWCYRTDGALAAVVAEVHNTYGDRHAYLVRADDAEGAEATLPKAMYVSPFNPVDGQYRITASTPSDRVSVTVRLDRDRQPAFVATLTGHRVPVRLPLLAAVAAAPTSWRVSALIRWQGVRLWRRGVRIEPRPVHAEQRAV